MLQWNTLLKGKVLLTAAALGAVSVVAIGGTYANFTATPTTIASKCSSILCPLPIDVCPP